MRRDYLRPYKDDVLATSSQRIFAFLVDGVIVMLISFLLMLLSMGIISNTKAYQSKIVPLNNAMIECYKIEEEARIYQFIGEGENKYNNHRPMEEIFKDYCLMHILLSYENDPKAFSDNATTIKNENNLPLASYETDQLAYFYVKYAPLYNSYNGTNNDVVDFKNYSPEAYFYRAYKDNAVDIEMWIFDEENYTIPYLKSNFAFDLYKYLFVDQSYQAGLTRYNLLGTNFKNLWEVQVDQLINSSRFEENYQIYKENYASLSYIVDIGTFSSYLVAFCIGYLLPQFIFKDMQTFGKKIFKTKVVDTKGYKALPWQSIIRNILAFFLFYCTCIVSCFLSGGNNAGWMYPLFEIGGYGFSPFSFMVISVFAAMISLIVLVANKKKKAIHDLVSDTVVIDMNYHIDTPIDVEATTIVEKENTETAYFDSSSFNNSERNNKDVD